MDEMEMGYDIDSYIDNGLYQDWQGCFDHNNEVIDLDSSSPCKCHVGMTTVVKMVVFVNTDILYPTYQQNVLVSNQKINP